MSADRLSPLDVSCLHIEDDVSHMHMVAGAGLTAVFSIGVEALSRGGYASEAEEGHSAPERAPAGMAVAIVSLLVVLAGIGYGISVALTK